MGSSSLVDTFATRLSAQPLRRWVNKDHQARLRFLVNDERALAKAVRCGLDPALAVQILRSVLCELLIGGDKLAGRERFTSAGCDDDAHSVYLRPPSSTFFADPRPAT